MNAEEVVSLLRLPDMKPILLKVNGWKANDKKLGVTRAEIVQG